MVIKTSAGYKNLKCQYHRYGIFNSNNCSNIVTSFHLCKGASSKEETVDVVIILLPHGNRET